MFIYIETLLHKRQDRYGAYKEYKVDSATFCFTGHEEKTVYSYNPVYEKGRFDRPHLEYYKVTLQESYRDAGKVKKRQCVLGIVGYYSLAEDCFTLDDYFCDGIEHAIEKFKLPEDYPLFDMVETKLTPLRKQILQEFHKSEEYKAVKMRKQIEKNYAKAKKDFSEKYGVDEHEYDYCYNIFGELMNQAYLDKLEEQKRAYQSYSSTYNTRNGSYDSRRYSSTFELDGRDYTEAEKTSLKKFYRMLAAKLHPDVNPDPDATKEMQLLNKLKQEWGV